MNRTFIIYQLINYRKRIKENICLKGLGIAEAIIAYSYCLI